MPVNTVVRISSCYGLVVVLLRVGREVAGATGLEPATAGFGDQCSTN
jgi:hypothetical protein